MDREVTCPETYRCDMYSQRIHVRMRTDPVCRVQASPNTRDPHPFVRWRSFR